MKLPIAALLHRFGQELTIHPMNGDICSCRAVLYPLQNCSPLTASPLGAVSTQRWVYFGIQPLAIGDTVLWNGDRLSVISCQSCGLSRTDPFFRAVLLQS